MSLIPVSRWLREQSNQLIYKYSKEDGKICEMTPPIEVNVFLIFLRLDVFFEVNYLTKLNDGTNQEKDKNNNRVYHK